MCIRDYYIASSLRSHRHGKVAMVENSGREAPTLEPDNARQEGGPALRVDSTSVVRSPSILNALQVLTDTIIKARKESP